MGPESQKAASSGQTRKELVMGSPLSLEPNSKFRRNETDVTTDYEMRFRSVEIRRPFAPTVF